MSWSYQSSKNSNLGIISPLIEENQFGESIALRSEILPSFNDIGPPDLIHFSKYHRSAQKDLGSYHYVTGLDLSSTAAPTAYLSTLTYSSSSSSSSSSTSNHPKIGTYCSYNSFQKCDLRIRISEPGDTSFQIIPNDRKRKTVSYFKSEKFDPSFWLEVYVSCIIRSVIISEDYSRQVSGLCQFNPFSTKTSAKNCLILMIKLLPKGYLVGCNNLTQSANNLQNYLIDSMIKIVTLTDLYDFTINEINTLYPDRQYELIIIKLLLLQNQEIKAVQKMYDHLNLKPRDGFVLNEQSKFLITKKRPDLALPLSLKAVEILPSEFECWTTLFKIHLLNNNISGALLALNSFPMYTQRHKDITREFPKSIKKFPKPQDGSISKIWDLAEFIGPVYGETDPLKYASPAEIEAIDPDFLKLHGATLIGTFSKAYDLLSLLVKLVGWDTLLKVRSEVFVMEEEYKQVNNASTLDLLNKKKFEEFDVQFKGKRLCERWLDSLFLILYDDLKSVISIEKEGLTNKFAKHSACEWELIGLAAKRVQHFDTSISALRTTLNAKFSFFAAHNFLKLYETLNDYEFLKLNENFDSGSLNYFGNLIPEEIIFEILITFISWNYRWYKEFQPLSLSILKRLTQEQDSISIKYKIISLYGDENIGSLIDRMINWIDNFK